MKRGGPNLNSNKRCFIYCGDGVCDCDISETKFYEQSHELVIEQIPPIEVKPCWCYKCNETRYDPVLGWPMVMMQMIVCRECGNKRCPRAAHHDNACTNSNEPGQPGSY